MADRRPDPLAEYAAKRDFARTPEPGAAPVRRSAGQPPLLVVQKHDATRLHWDLRLEVDGVLKSWAVTRGPSIDPEDKRLAVRTEDHPLSYADFEGVIPARAYGGGTVMLWDHGHWQPVPGKSARDLDDGHLHFVAHGHRMRGEWLLVRMKPRAGERRENWLLRKVEDKEAGEGDILVERALTSVKTGRTMEQIASGASPVSPERKRSRSASARAKGPMPAFHPPMLATLVHKLPGGEDWLFEVKYDGYRCLIGLGGSSAVGWTRTGLDWSDRFRSVLDAAQHLPAGSALLDGEIVALDEAGRPSFSALQRALKAGEPLSYFAFDLLEIDGEDLTARPLAERKQRLAALFERAEPPLFYSDHIEGDGRALFQAMVDKGYEGVIAKRASSPYAGERSDAWLKIKVERREEFVIIGWIASSKRGRPFASLLLGQHDQGQLLYKGRVGTGFDSGTAEDIRAQLARLARSDPVIANSDGVVGKAQWVEPVLVAEVRYAEYTHEGVLRHASFIGLRGDKPAAEVTGETAMPSPDSPWIAPTPSLRITHADRPLFGPEGPSKGDLASWYEAAAPLMLPFIAQRPVALLRCPQGIDQQCFFQKHVQKGWGKEIDALVVEEADGSTDPVFLLNDKAAILRCVQMGAIEFHGWGSRADDLERPDRLVFDLDPDESMGFADIAAAARQMRDHLADMGLVTFAMVTGGKGIHVIAPLDPDADWAVAEHFARSFAQALEQAEPRRYTASMSKARRKGRIFIDWMRNRRGSTAVLPYSVRARAGAPVAVPVAWDELESLPGANCFSLLDPAAIVGQGATVGDDWGKASQRLAIGD
jgi:bifunctional non-homologous end joining protein LigD